MSRTFLEAIEHRRSHYSLSAAKRVECEDIVRVIDRIMLAMPSAYNSQSSRVVVLFGIHHLCLWGIVKQSLEQIISPEAFVATREKIDRAFASGYGTVLYYEDMDVVESMKREFPTYAAKFDEYSEHTSAMHQLAIWTALEDMGLGASLQHYNPLIDAKVASQWNIPHHWRMVAQMPFGVPLDRKTERVQNSPLSERRLVFWE